MRHLLSAWDRYVLLRWPTVWTTQSHWAIPLAVFVNGVLIAFARWFYPITPYHVPDIDLIFQGTLFLTRLASFFWVLAVVLHTTTRPFESGIYGIQRILLLLATAGVVNVLPWGLRWALINRTVDSIPRHEAVAVLCTDWILQHVQSVADDAGDHALTELVYHAYGYDSSRYQADDDDSKVFACSYFDRCNADTKQDVMFPMKLDDDFAELRYSLESVITALTKVPSPASSTLGTYRGHFKAEAVSEWLRRTTN